jgi:hypothetical protein
MGFVTGAPFGHLSGRRAFIEDEGIILDARKLRCRGVPALQRLRRSVAYSSAEVASM